MSVTQQAPERVITRYGNRKLYDSAARRYVTIEDLAAMIAAGTNVRVEDRDSGDDITTVVLAQVILEGVREKRAAIPNEVLARLIRLASTPATVWRTFSAAHDLPARARQEAERIVAGWITRGRLTLDEGLALRQEITQAVAHTTAEIQRTLEARLDQVLHSERRGRTTGALRGLEQRLAAFDALLAPPGATRAPARPSGRRPDRTRTAPHGAAPRRKAGSKRGHESRTSGR